MDPNYRIYEDDPDKIPAEDKARLHGYLKGRAETDKVDRLREQLEEAKAQVEKMEAAE